VENIKPAITDNKEDDFYITSTMHVLGTTGNLVQMLVKAGMSKSTLVSSMIEHCTKLQMSIIRRRPWILFQKSIVNLNFGREFLREISGFPEDFKLEHEWFGGNFADGDLPSLNASTVKSSSRLLPVACVTSTDVLDILVDLPVSLVIFMSI
jgi:hypothetical protein